MHEEIKNALRASDGDYTEIRLEREFRNTIKYEKNNLMNLDSSVESGGIVRTLVSGGWGIATFNSADELSKKVDRATEIARTAAPYLDEPIELADSPTEEETVQPELERDFRNISLDQKRRLLQGYNETILKFDDKIKSTKANYSDSYREITYANTEGTWITQSVPDVTLSLVAVAKSDEAGPQVSHESVGEAVGFELVTDREEMATVVAQRALDLLDAEPVKGGEYTVLLNPKLAGVFIHEAFGHLCEADHFYKNERLQEIMRIGEKFGPNDLNVVDDGYISGRRGNTPFDDEGVQREKTYLVKDGKLNNFLHSRETAAKMGERPTGNARAVSYRHEPIVRMTNTYIENGDQTFQEMIKSVDKGIYAIDAYGGQTQLEQFTFSAGHGRLIENGKIGPVLKDVVLTGNIFETLGNVAGIGDDLEIIGSGGGCGKGGQFPLPVTTGSPHVKIKNLTVGGR
ncbi:MAG: TldD/PmbA family protein [Candidatus Acetothermia bacterium]